MRYLSVCSGIEAATVAWHGLGWTPVAFSEIEPFPCAVLAHHYPDVPNLGDITRWLEWPQELLLQADLLVGGTPCQSFSVAGLRKGLDDERGNIMLHYVRLANAIDDLRRNHGLAPLWVLWENVPGVFSDKTNGFGALLGGLCGSDAAVPRPPRTGWTDAGVATGPQRHAAWRVLDAQFFGVAQRRRRVFVLSVGGAGAWACADALLPLSESVRWNPPSRGEAGENVAGTIAARFGVSRNNHEELAPVAHSLRAEGFDASGDGTVRGIPLIAERERERDRATTLPEVCGCLSDGAHRGGGLNGQDAYTGRIIPVPERGRDGAAGLGNGDVGDR